MQSLNGSLVWSPSYDVHLSRRPDSAMYHMTRRLCGPMPRTGDLTYSRWREQHSIFEAATTAFVSRPPQLQTDLQRAGVQTTRPHPVNLSTTNLCFDMPYADLSGSLSSAKWTHSSSNGVPVLRRRARGVGLLLCAHELHEPIRRAEYDRRLCAQLCRQWSGQCCHVSCSARDVNGDDARYERRLHVVGSMTGWMCVVVAPPSGGSLA